MHAVFVCECGCVHAMCVWGEVCTPCLCVCVGGCARLVCVWGGPCRVCVHAMFVCVGGCARRVCVCVSRVLCGAVCVLGG